MDMHRSFITYNTVLLQGISREAHTILSPCTALPSHPFHVLGRPHSWREKLSAAARFLQGACRSVWLWCAKPCSPTPLERSCRIKAAAIFRVNLCCAGSTRRDYPSLALVSQWWCTAVLWSCRLGRELCCSRLQAYQLHHHSASWRARSACPSTLHIKRKQVPAPGLGQLARY